MGKVSGGGLDQFDYEREADLYSGDIRTAANDFHNALEHYDQIRSQESADTLAQAALHYTQELEGSELSTIDREHVQGEIQNKLVALIQSDGTDRPILLTSVIQVTAEATSSTDLLNNLERISHIKEAIKELKHNIIPVEQLINTYSNNPLNRQIAKSVINDPHWPWSPRQRCLEEFEALIESYFNEFSHKVAHLIERAKANSIREESNQSRLPGFSMAHYGRHHNQKRSTPMNLRETLLELENQIKNNPLTKKDFANKLSQQGVIKEALPTLDEVAREHAINLKKKRMKNIFGNHIRGSSKDQHQSETDIANLASSAALYESYKETFAAESYRPIIQDLLPTLNKIQIKSNDLDTKTRVSKSIKQQISQKAPPQRRFSLRNLRTRSDLKFKMRRKDARKADRLAKRVNCMKNSRPELKSLKKDLDNLALSKDYHGSFIRRLRSR